MPAPKASTSAISQAATTLAVTIPSTVAVGDLILIRGITLSNTTVTHDGTGYTTVQDGQNGGSTSEVLARKVAAAGDAGSTVTFTFGVSNRCSAVVVVMASADVNASAPLSPTPTYTDVSTATTSPASPAITASSSSTILVWQGMQGTSGAGAITWTAPTGTTSVLATSTAAGAGRNCAQGVAWVAGSGTVGPYTATASQAVVGRMFTIAVPPAGAAAPAVKWWDGTSEVSAALSWWDGATETAVSSLEIA